jgi:hypothetical protein
MHHGRFFDCGILLSIVVLYIIFASNPPHAVWVEPRVIYIPRSIHIYHNNWRGEETTTVSPPYARTDDIGDIQIPLRPSAIVDKDTV